MITKILYIHFWLIFEINRYSTISFTDPVRALKYFNKNSSDCMLVITDYGMPHMSGLDLIEKIREKYLDYKIKNKSF